MASVATTPHAPFGAITAYRMISAFDGFFGRFRDWNVRRQTSNALHQLSDHELSDIGLIRGDLDALPATLFVHRF